MASYVPSAIVTVGALLLSCVVVRRPPAFFRLSQGCGRRRHRLCHGAVYLLGLPVGQEHRGEEPHGPAINIVSGLSVGMLSTLVPILLVCVGVLVRLSYGRNVRHRPRGRWHALHHGITVAVDAYGPIADNAGGIAQMAKTWIAPSAILPTKLDSVGNTTAAIGKGFAIGSAALTALALFASFSRRKRTLP